MYSQNGLLVFYPLCFLLIHNEWPTTMAKSTPECALLWIVKRERTHRKGYMKNIHFLFLSSPVREVTSPYGVGV